MAIYYTTVYYNIINYDNILLKQNNRRMYKIK